MTGTKRLLSMVAVAVVLAGLAGCGPGRVSLAMKFTPNQQAAFEVKSEVVKNLKFEQPSLDKVMNEETRKTVQTAFTQQIESVDADGSATAKITITGLKYYFAEKNNIKLDIDSSKEKDKNEPLMQVIGQSYRIKISPGGKVSVVDAEQARNAVTSGTAATIVKGLFSDESIISRHEVPGLPEQAGSMIAVGKGWKTLRASPPGMFTPRSYEKIYTLSKLEGPKGKKVACVNMTGQVSAVPAPDEKTGPSNLGPLAKMFDVADSYSGRMVLQVDSGAVSEYDEKLCVTYTVVDTEQKRQPDKGPDTLVVSFTQSIEAKKVN